MTKMIKYIWLKNDAGKINKQYKKIDLQLFAADGKTEKATPKKRQDARKKGQVFQSREISASIVMLIMFMSLKTIGSFIYTETAGFMRRIFENYTLVKEPFSINALSRLFIDALLVFIKVSGPIMIIAMVAGVAVVYAQIGFLFTTEPLGFKFDRINPINGFKRMFSMRAIIEMLKSIIKVTAAAYIVYSYIKDRQADILNLTVMNVESIAVYIADFILNVAVRICMVFVIFGAADYLYQWWDYEKNLMMTKQEVKEEYKQTEGNPEIKSKIKQKQRQLSMRRMLHEVPNADVVITNPTHYAVALKYDAEISDAPIVIAKGQDYMALRIKEKAKESNVEIVENKVLARSLYNSVEVGEKIPEELYQAVAEVLAFVYSLKNKR